MKKQHTINMSGSEGGFRLCCSHQRVDALNYSLYDMEKGERLGTGVYDESEQG